MTQTTHNPAPHQTTRRAGALAAIALSVAATACNHEPGVPAGRELAVIKGERFYLEPVLDNEARIKGLGGRDHIDPDGGMVFAFPSTQYREFVMRDCIIPIDIAFLSDSGRVLTLHAMVPEEPQKPDEDLRAYENRLTRYPSRFPTRYAVEVAGGTWDRLGLAEGDVISLDFEGLKVRAR